MWFTENPWPGIILFGLVGLSCLALMMNSQRKIYGLLSGLFFLLAGGCYLLERAIITDGELAQQRVVSMAEDFQKRSPQVLDHISPQAPELQTMVKSVMDLVEVQDDLRLTDFQTNVTNEGSRAQVRFRANATLSVRGMGNVGRQPARFEVTLGKEQGTWKLLAVRRLNVIKDEEMPLTEARQ